LTCLVCPETPHEFDQATSVLRPPGTTIHLRAEAAEGLRSARTLDQGHIGGLNSLKSYRGRARDPPLSLVMQPSPHWP
jgi:hypothetical protein